MRDGAFTSATLDAALRDVGLRLGPDEPPIEVSRVDGRFVGRQAKDGGELRIQRLSVQALDAAPAPLGDARVAWRRAADGALVGGELAASRIDLGFAAALLARVPPAWLPEGVRPQVARLAPRGVASQVEARWDAPAGGARRYRVAAELRGLALAAEGAGEDEGSAWYAGIHRPSDTLGRPGVEGLDLDLVATDAGGHARLALRDGALELPGVFEAPRVALERFDAEVDWKIEPGAAGAPPRVELRTRGARLANADAEGRFDAVWSTGATRADGAGRYPGVLDLTGQLTRAQAARVARYLPLGVGAETRRYVEQAVLAGRAPSIDFRVRGDLHDFPFAARGAAPTGEFRIAARLEGVRLDAQPQPERLSDGTLRRWPPFDDVSGELVIDRLSMELRNVQGRLAGVGSGGWRVGVRGGIRDLTRQPTLTLEGSGRGPLDDGLRFLGQSPVGAWLGGALDTVVTLDGPQAPVGLQLALTLPLEGGDHARVRGSVQLAGNDLRLRPDVPPFGNARARIAFTERDFTVSGGAARTLGGELAFEGGQQPDGSLRFTGQGSASVEALRRSPELGEWTRIATALSGQTDYRLALGFVRGRPEWQVSSSLVGLTSTLPAPLAKAAGDALPLRVQLGQAASGASAAPREQLRVELGADSPRLLEAHLLREQSAGGTRVLRGGLGVRDAAPQPDEGIAASVNVAQLDVDAWQGVAQRWGAAEAPAAVPAGRSGAVGGAASAPGSAAPAGAGDGGRARGPNGGTGAAAAPAGANKAAGTESWSAYLPRTVALRADELRVADRRLTRVVAGATRGRGQEAGVWRINGQAAELEGYAEFHPAAAGGAARVLARLTRMALPESEAQAVSRLLDSAAPTRPPALDIVVEALELRGKRLGRVEVQAQNRAGGGWQLDRLRLVNPDARFEATGEWATAPDSGQRLRAGIDFQLDILDGGALLGRLGQPGVVQGAKGRMSGRIAWLGSPFEIDYPSLSGRMNVAIERGQFLQADPGAAKLLGVLSLQSLPRRLLFDFRDLYEKGFAFDSVTGDVVLTEGVATTHNLRMRGVQALVLVEGSADVARETQDLDLWVVPDINAGAASLAYAAINPALGLGSFLAQWLLRRPLMQANTRQFHVTGSWLEPKLERVERRAGDALPAAAEAPAAPSSGPAPAPPPVAPGPAPPGPSPAAASPSSAAPSPSPTSGGPPPVTPSGAAVSPSAAAAPSDDVPSSDPGRARARPFPPGKEAP